MRRQIRPVVLLLLASTAVACATAQTTYFRMSYVELAPANHPKLKAYDGDPEFELVENMETRGKALHEAGYAMLGYSQFVSPLAKSVSKSYSTKYARMKGARYVALEQPQPGASNLHYYLATYWGELQPDSHSLGVTLTELPEELLQKIDEDMNMVIVDHTIPKTAAARAGVQTGDVIYAFNGERMTRVSQVVERIDRHAGEEVTLQLLRDGDAVELPVTLVETATLGSSDKSLDFSVAPWTGTEPTDWSNLSFAAIAQANILTWQRMEQQRQAEAERARAAAQAQLAYLEANRENVLEQSHLRIQVDPRAAEEAMRAASESLAKDMGRKQLDAMNIWFDNLQPMYLNR